LNWKVVPAMNDGGASRTSAVVAGISTTSTSRVADAPQRGQALGDQVLVRR
jgi:uncharacterized protein YerC